MYLGKYLEEHAGILILQVLLALLSWVYLWLTGTEMQVILCLDLVWLLAAAGYLGQDFYRKKKRAEEIQEIFSGLEEKYLFTEVIRRPREQLEEVYFELARKSNKSMKDKIEEVLRDKREYKEYIENWVHEIKNPIAALEMHCENHPSEESRQLYREAYKIEELVNQALYYARSGSVEKDYFVREFSVGEALVPALQDCRAEILEKGLLVEAGEFEEKVYTDPKWVSFILKQILSNAVKYTTAEKGKIEIFLEKKDNGLWLSVRDNGCGIAQADLPRVCEKGFTGGQRQKRQATGMGLYLAKKLCSKLGLAFTIDSLLDQGTTVSVGFPIGRLTRPGLGGI